MSGAIRRFAYKYSEATLTHWMTLLLADRVDVVEGLVSDLKEGTMPNLWIEKGWRSEWKTNRQGVIRKVAIGVATATIVAIIVSKKRSKKSLSR
ncbi:MAG: hypothetical protein ABIN94_01000 [Ferruginibacter sp.]